MRCLPDASRCRPALAVAVALAVAAGVPTVADVVERRGGSRLEGTVVSLDAEALVLDTGSSRLRIPRSELVSIVFVAAPALKVELKNVRSDDAVDVLLDGDEVLRDAREGGSWVDLTDRLKDGNNALRLRVHNERGSWAYRLHLRVNGRVLPLECGAPGVAGAGCTCCGKTGRELGTIDDLPTVWIHVDRATGSAEVLP